MEQTFWKTDPIPERGIVVAHLLPIGSSKYVTDGLLSLPQSHPFFSRMTAYGYATIRWDVEGGVLLSYRDEVEFGGGVFSIIVARGDVSNAEFFKLYLNVYELFGVLLLERDSFVTIRQFKKRL